MSLFLQLRLNILSLSKEKPKKQKKEEERLNILLTNNKKKKSTLNIPSQLSYHQTFCIRVIVAIYIDI